MTRRGLEAIVTPLLERRTDVRPVRLARASNHLAKVHRVLLVQVRWGEIGPASGPPRNQVPRPALRGLLLDRWCGNLEVAIIHVDGRRVWVARVERQERVQRRRRGRRTGGRGWKSGPRASTLSLEEESIPHRTEMLTLASSNTVSCAVDTAPGTREGLGTRTRAHSRPGAEARSRA